MLRDWSCIVWVNDVALEHEEYFVYSVDGAVSDDETELTYSYSSRDHSRGDQPPLFCSS